MPPKVKVPFHKNNSPKSNHQNKLDDLKTQNQFSQDQQNNSLENTNNSDSQSQVATKLENHHLKTQNLHNLPNMQSNTSNENQGNLDSVSNSSSILDSQNSNLGTNSGNLELEKLQKEIIELKLKNEELTNRILRMAADTQNSSKQEEITLLQTRKQTKKSVVNLILPFLDTLNLAFAFVPPTEDEKMQKFVQTLQKSFEKLMIDLNFSGIELIIPKANDTFDPNIMMPLNSPELQEENQETAKIKGTASLGVKIDGQVIRSASIMF